MKANVLLVMPKTGYIWDEWATPPSGIAYVSAYLKKQGFSVYTLNLNLESEDLETVLNRDINRYKINVLGTGELVVNYDKLKEICKAAKTINPDLKVWIGGGFVTNSPEEALALVPDADFAMIGEGEYTSAELVAAIEAESEDYSHIPGLIVRADGGRFIKTADREPIEDLDSIPFPDWDGFGLIETHEKYRGTKDGVVASVISSRSCPNSCTFCSKTIKKQSYRKRSLDNIFAEIDLLVNQYGVTRLNFSDELFADNTNRLFEFCDRIERYNIAYRVSMHIGKNLTYDLLKRMRESGCEVIFYGLESANNAILKNMRKFITVEEIERCLDVTKRAGIIAEGNFIFGDPMETPETIRETTTWIKEHFTMGLFEVAAIRLYPGSQLYEDAVASGKIEDKTKFIEEKCPLVNVTGMSDEQYQKMLNEDLTVMQKMRTVRQKDVSLTIGRDGISVSYICPSCNQKKHMKIKDKSHILRMYTAHCDQCGALEYLNLLPIYLDVVKRI